MRYYLLMIAPLTGSLFSSTSAQAHFAVSDSTEINHTIFWIYGILLFGVAGLIIYRKFVIGGRPAGERALKRELNELERALKSCQSDLKNAEDYPNQCGLTYTERQDRVNSATSIEGLIAKTKTKLAMG